MKWYNSSEPSQEDRLYLVDNLVRLGIDESTAWIISVEAYDTALAAVEDLIRSRSIIDFLNKFYNTKE